jgi:hypothetical protein
VIKCFCNESRYFSGFWGLFAISFYFDSFYLRVYCTVFCAGYHVFLLLDSSCYLSAVSFILTAV